MTPELELALKRHTQWFGSYKASGELKKIQVWLVVNGGKIEFLTPGNSYKVKRARKNPRVICYVGSKDGPAISGTARIITDRSEVARVYRGYWKTHPLRMAIVIGLRLWIEMLLNKRRWRYNLRKKSSADSSPFCELQSAHAETRFRYELCPHRTRGTT
jgi:pyridoxamine 5'-phosphate oxidase-like protein